MSPEHAGAAGQANTSASLLPLFLGMLLAPSKRLSFVCHANTTARMLQISWDSLRYLEMGASGGPCYSQKVQDVICNWSTSCDHHPNLPSAAIHRFVSWAFLVCMHLNAHVLHQALSSPTFSAILEKTNLSNVFSGSRPLLLTMLTPRSIPRPIISLSADQPVPHRMCVLSMHQSSLAYQGGSISVEMLWFASQKNTASAFLAA